MPLSSTTRGSPELELARRREEVVHERGHDDLTAGHLVRDPRGVALGVTEEV
jgi:hypothetical protein